MKKHYTVSWFSAGVSSAVATRLAIDEIDEIFYIHIDDQHPDTLRFVRECEAWFGKPITILQHEKYQSVEPLLRDKRFISGPYGAPCTATLKKKVRKKWERDNADKAPFRYAWGFDYQERDRVEKTLAAEPEHHHFFPLVERRMSKQEAHEILKASGIKRPAMYEMGYQNNNCIGCVKGGMGYWNKIRVDFPEVFAARAKLERDVGASCINGVFLDELDPNAGKKDGPIVDECGLLCGLQALPKL
jgi:hypothetical protein